MATHSSTFLPGKCYGRRSLVGCSPWGLEESDTTERLHFHFSLSCTGEGNDNPLQCSWLENPRDGEPGGLASTGLHRVSHDWSDLAAVAAAVTSTQHTKAENERQWKKGEFSAVFHWEITHKPVLGWWLPEDQITIKFGRWNFRLFGSSCGVPVLMIAHWNCSFNHSAEPSYASLWLRKRGKFEIIW